jgi:hypothetical protein
LLLLSQSVVISESALAGLDHGLWSGLHLLLEHVEDHDSVRIGSVEDPSGHGTLVNAPLMAPWADRGIGRDSGIERISPLCSPGRS